MSRISSPMRGRRPAKRLPMAELRALFRDRRIWAALGIVVKPAEGASDQHWELHTDDAGNVTDILVEVQLVPSKIEVTARLGGYTAAYGIAMVPNVGDEVIVHVPDGEVDWMPVVVAPLSTGGVAGGNAGAQAPAPGRIVVVGDVYVHDGSGGAEPLVKKSEYDGHTHDPGTFTAPSGGGPVTGLSGGADSVAGTTNLKAK
jgi:hypothetical protein